MKKYLWSCAFVGMLICVMLVQEKAATANAAVVERDTAYWQKFNDACQLRSIAQNDVTRAVQNSALAQITTERDLNRAVLHPLTRTIVFPLRRWYCNQETGKGYKAV